MFDYTPTVAGLYTVAAAGTCPSTSTQFTAGCSSACSSIGGPEPSCPTCGSTDPPVITSNKSDNIIRTICPKECKAEDGDANGETVSVTIEQTPGGVSPSCYELTVTTNGAVEAISVPPLVGSWPGSLTVQLQGKVGLGSATIDVTFYEFDTENACWKTSQSSLDLQAKPDDDCECPDCPVGGRGGGAIRAVPTLGTIQLGDVKLTIRAGRTNLLRIPKILAVHPNGDVEVLLPDRANSVIFQPGAGFLEGWILGGPPGRGELIQLSNINEGKTYRFETAPVGPLPFRLQKIKRFDFTTHSSYVYDVAGDLIEIHVGNASSTTYFELAYDVDAMLDTITPYVDGLPEVVRAVQLVYDGDIVIGADGVVCNSCVGESRRYHFNPDGYLTRITDIDGVDLEVYTYDGEGRLIELQRRDTGDNLVIVKTVEYLARGEALAVTIHERVSATEERIRVESYDDQGRIVRIDRYLDLFAHDSAPSGDVLATQYTYDVVELDGVQIDTREEIDPAGVTDVTVVKTFDNGLPLFLPDAGDTLGWQIPDEAFKLAGMQEGDAVISPQIQGATATLSLEVATSGTYFVSPLLHEAVTQVSGDIVCVEFQIDDGGGGFTPGYAVLSADDPPPVDPWLDLYSSCANFGVPGEEHAGFALEAGATYAFTMVFAGLVPSPNPTDGWGVDGVTLSRFDADPAVFPIAPYVASEGAGQYIRSYRRGTDDSIADSQIRLAGYSEVMSAFLTLYAVDARGGVTYFTYNSIGMVTSTVGPEVTLLDGGGTVTLTGEIEYDDNNLVTRTGRLGPNGTMIYTDYGYDEFGRLISTLENADGDVSEQAFTQYTHNIFGEQTSVTDACGNVTETLYGAAGRVTDVISYESGGSGDLLKQRKVEYDVDGLVETDRVALDTGPFAFDTPAGWADTTIGRDLIGRQIRRTVPAPGATTLTTTYDYDYFDGLIEQVNPDGSIERIVYDGLGNIVQKSIEGAGVTPLVTTFTYNAVGRLEVTDAPDEGMTTYEYDAFGRVSTITKSARAELTYDTASQVIHELAVDPADDTPLAEVVKDYDVLGRLIRLRNRASVGIDSDDDPVTITAFNPAGQVGAMIRKADGNTDLDNYEAGDQLEAFTFDDLGRTITEVNGAGEQIDLTYDSCGVLLTQTLDPGGLNQVIAYQNDALGRRTRTTDPELHYIQTAHNSVDLETMSTRYDNTDTPLSRRINEYEAGGWLIRWARLADPTLTTIDPAADFVEEHQYDATTGLRVITQRYVAGVPKPMQLEYDGMGRRTTVRYPDNPSQHFVAMAFSDDTGLIDTATRGDPLGARVTRYTHDAFGRRTLDTRLSSRGDPDHVFAFEYDALGRQIGLTGWDGKLQTRTYDLLGRVTVMIDDAGNLARQQDMAYDRLGKLTTVTIPRQRRARSGHHVCLR